MATSTLSSLQPSAVDRTSAGPTTFWPFVLYGLTGFTGVLAEQGFEKYITLLVGATAFSSAIVTFAYFLGFALGAWAVAALIRRERIARPLLTYGALELLVGLCCVAFTYAFHPLSAGLAPFQTPDQTAVYKFAIRFAFGAVLILPSAALMGASFPLIARALDGEDLQSGRRWIAAYGCNLGGAIVAALGGAFVVLPALGVRGAMWLVLAVGAAVLGACLWLGEPEIERRVQEADSDRREPVRQGGLLLAAAFLSGVIFFALEVLWAHLIGTLLGSSVYAFASMLGCVLIGLLLGSLRTPGKFSRLFLMAAAALLAQWRLWDYIQIAFLVQLPAWIKSFYTIEAYKFLLGAALIVPAATLLGMLYPALLRSPALNRPGTGYFVGYLNMANSAGCLLGSVLGVFFLIPVLGSEWSLKAIGMLLACLGWVLMWREKPAREALVKATVGVVLMIGLAPWGRWERLLLTSGQNVSFGRTEAAEVPVKPDEDHNTGVKLIYLEEHAQGGFTSVVEVSHSKSRPQRLLLSNGKFEGTDDLSGQGFAQIAFAAIPAQFTGGFGRALQIGLGTGQSVHALQRLGFETVDIAEYAAGIVGAARQYFTSVNGRVLGEPNVHLHVEDGRNFLLASPGDSFDVISIEVSSVWFAGATNLYSREFYELAESRLRPGGTFQQWVQFHHTSPRELGAQMATLRSVFPYVSVWSAGGQGMMVATEQPQMLTEDRRVYMRAKLRGLAGVDQADQAAVERQVFESRLLSAEALDRAVESGRFMINTDHNRWIEYATPRYNWTDDDGTKNLAWLNSFAGPVAADATAAAR